jgi:hypothetical protein
MNFLSQVKLTKTEWDNIERPITDEREKIVLNMINICSSDEHAIVKSLKDYLKLGDEFDDVVFHGLLASKINKLNKEDCLGIDNFLGRMVKSIKKINKKDKIRIQNSISKFDSDLKNNIIDFQVIEHLRIIAKYIYKYEDECYEQNKFIFSILSINNLYQYHIDKLNSILCDIISIVLQKESSNIDIKRVLTYSNRFIVNNENNSTKNVKLYYHQKQIFEIFKHNPSRSNFVWYCAPTSSGKTLTPIGLCNYKKVIFMCASKHIGISLAKSAFNVGRKIGFAFGCNHMEDIRLNYNAINKFEIKKNGRKVPDHTDGTKVEIMICDAKSYEIAMIYMKAFNSVSDLVLFWDEPTIGLDVHSHPLHDVIRKNWSINVIPNIVFSCATLPNIDMVQNVITCHESKFSTHEFHNITAHDELTNVLLYDDCGNVIMPHTHFKSLHILQEFLLYHGLKYHKFYNCTSCCDFILFMDGYEKSNVVNKNFNSIFDINMKSIKNLYVKIFSSISNQTQWDKIQKSFFKKYPKHTKMTHDDEHYIGTDLTAYAAKSLTNGPTLYITNNILNVSKYLLSKGNIDKTMLVDIECKISHNNKVSNELNKKIKDYEDKIEKFKDNDNVMANERFPEDVLELKREIDTLEKKIIPLTLDSRYRPNTKDHYMLWNKNSNVKFEESDVYCSSIDDVDVKEISQLDSLQNIFKHTFLMGIGIFTNHSMTNDSMLSSMSNDNIYRESNKYVEVVKSLAEKKSLYLILADSDYIYGTNYQFSHCYLGKDIQDITQEKIIQCIGRVGRKEKNKHFSFRFRSQEQIDTLYSIPYENVEANNMNKLFAQKEK